MAENTQLEYDIALQRLKSIAASVERAENTFNAMMSSASNTHKQINGPDIGLQHYQNWYGAIATLWKIVKPYIDDKEEVEKIEEKRKPLRKFALYTGDHNGSVSVEEIEEFHDLVQEKRIEVGLDIPQTNNENEEGKTLIQGL